MPDALPHFTAGDTVQITAKVGDDSYRLGIGTAQWRKLQCEIGVISGGGVNYAGNRYWHVDFPSGRWSILEQALRRCANLQTVSESF